MLTLLAVSAGITASPEPMMAFILVPTALFLGARSVSGLLNPRLVLRLENDTLWYRQTHGRWTSCVRQPFVSPWFIGWRGRGWMGFSVFPQQLSRDDYRRLARCLRQSGWALTE